MLLKIINCQKKIGDNFNQAFSLVEVIVVVSLLSIITAIGVASYNKFNTRRRLEKAALELEANLRLVQNKAIANEKDCNVCGGSDNNCNTITGDKILTGWVVDLNNLTKPVYYGDCEGSNFPPAGIELLDLDFDDDGSDEVALSYSGPAKKILFETLGGTDLAGTATITLEDDFGNSFILRIYATGDIVMSD